MNDLGFGIIDRRTVLVILLGIFVAAAVWGNPLPIDTTSVISTFTSVIVLTGFIFIVRNLGRVILAALTIGSVSLFRLFVPKKEARSERSVPNAPKSRWSQLSSFGSEVAFLGLLPLFMDWSPQLGFSTENYPLLWIVRALDRAILVGVVLLCTIPQVSAVRQEWGMIGIIVMLITYVLTGAFSLFLKDAISQAEENRLNN